MALGASLNRSPLTRADAEACVAAVDADVALSLPAIWLPMKPDPANPDRTVVGVMHLLMVRAGGFMIVSHDREEFRTALENLGTL